jgi:hypothetical protein
VREAVGYSGVLAGRLVAESRIDRFEINHMICLVISF